MSRHHGMRDEFDEAGVLHLSQLKALKENETPIFQKYHDSLNGARENTPGRELHWSERKTRVRSRDRPQGLGYGPSSGLGPRGSVSKALPSVPTGRLGQGVPSSVSSDQMSNKWKLQHRMGEKIK